MSYQKTYGRINWENYPSDKSPLNDVNLNKIDYAVNEVDNRILELDVKKLDLAVANGMVKSMTYNQTNGVFTITYLNGSSDTIDTKLEKLAVNFSYDPTAQQLIITLDDGTTQKVDMSALITQYEFSDTDTVAFSVDGGGKVSANVKNGSITEDKLRPDYLADIKVQAANAQNSVEAAASHAQVSENYLNLSKSYAIGTEGQIRENDTTDNAKYYSEQARQVAEGLKGALIPMGNVLFEGLPDTSTAGYMYNISDGFTTTDRFKEGAGHAIPAGANVYYTADGYWDILAGTPVAGVKGAAETDYQQGYISLTPENIGALPSSSVVYGNAVTVAGYALDAREANPNIDGSLGAQINAANIRLSSIELVHVEGNYIETPSKANQPLNWDNFVALPTIVYQIPNGKKIIGVSIGVSNIFFLYSCSKTINENYLTVSGYGFNCANSQQNCALTLDVTLIDD